MLTCALALGLPPDPHTLQQLHISSTSYHIAILVLLVPYGIVWYATFYSFSKLRAYVKKIKGSEDGKAFYSIMIGIGVLAYGLVLPTAASLIMQNIVSYSPGFKPASVIINNYLGLLVALTTFAYVNNGTFKLTKLVKKRPENTGIRLFAAVFITLAAVFTSLVINYHAEHAQTYYLNTPLLIVTFIIPALFTWFIALLGASEIRLYARFVKGLLYRRALRQFSSGIVVVIIASVAGQLIDNTFAEKASHSLASLLLLDYALLAILVLGLVLMALGTKKLMKLEEA